MTRNGNISLCMHSLFTQLTVEMHAKTFSFLAVYTETFQSTETILTSVTRTTSSFDAIFSLVFNNHSFWRF